jgi:hypothetical protein
MDEEIAGFMLLASKFEYFLINFDQKFAHVDGGTKAVTGINWEQVGQSLENKSPFAKFDIANSGFQIFKEEAPQYLTAKEGGGLKWDSDQVHITDWQVLLGRSYARLRNNVAHGNKAQLPAPFTHKRTKEFLEAGRYLIQFVARAHDADDSWANAIQFK